MVFQSGRRISRNKTNLRRGGAPGMPELRKVVVNVNFTDRMGDNTLTRKLGRQEKQMLEEHLEELLSANLLDFSEINDVDLEQLKSDKHNFVLTFTFTNPLPADQVQIVVRKYIETCRAHGLTLEDGIEYILDEYILAVLPDEMKESMPVALLEPLTPVSKSETRWESQTPPTPSSSLSVASSVSSSKKKHYGPFMCELNDKGSRCVQSGERMDMVNCRINDNNNCALALGHQVVHRSKRSPSPKRVRSKRAVGESKPNVWIEHIRAYQATHPGMKWKTAMKESRASYDKTEDRSRQNVMNGGMEVSVRDFEGRLTTYEVESSDTIDSLWTKIMDKQGYSDRNRLSLVFGSKLQDGRTLADYNIKSGSKISLTYRCEGN
jgi:hypothetical protein